MEREKIVNYMKTKKKVVIITFVLLLVAFVENYYLNCSLKYTFPGCELGWIFVVLALIVLLMAYLYRK
jgi:hypothetical protein